MTYMTIDKARGEPEKNAEGKSVPSKTPEPAYYALVPFAVAGDTATMPLQLLVWLMMQASGIKC